MCGRIVIRAEIRRLGPGVHWRLLRAGPLTPYLVETLTEDAVWAGRPSRLRVTVSASTSDQLLATVREAFAGLDGRGVRVKIRRRRDRAVARGRPAPRHTAA